MQLTNTEIKSIRALGQKKYRKERRLFTVEGIKTVHELVDSSLTIDAIYSLQEFPFLASVDAQLVHIIKAKELERISALQTPNNILAVAQIPSHAETTWNSPLVLILDGIRDPGNLGTIIRTAKWFGVDTIFCSEDCADAYDRKVVQSSMGALFHINISYQPLDLVIGKLKENNYTVMGAAMRGTSIYSLNKPDKIALVIGSESHGIRTAVLEQLDQQITIPNNEHEQRIESLNAGIATSIILSELTRPS